MDDTASTNGEPKPQNKQVCRFFTSKGKCSSRWHRICDLMTYLDSLDMLYGASRDAYHATSTDCPLQAVALEMHARMPILPEEMDRHPDQNRIAKAAMPRLQQTSTNGDISHRLSMTQE